MVGRLDVLLYVVKRLGTIEGKHALQHVMYFVNEIVKVYSFKWGYRGTTSHTSQPKDTSKSR